MKRKVAWSTRASRDYLELFSYISADNPVAANRVGRRILDCTKQLGDFATGRHGRVTGTYEKVVPKLPYIVVYALVASDGHEIVSIVRVIHAARNWPEEELPD